MKWLKWNLRVVLLSAIILLPVSWAFAQEETEEASSTEQGETNKDTTNLATDQGTSGQVGSSVSQKERAEQFKKSHPNLEKKMEQMTPEQRAKAQEMRDKLKNMTPEQRKAAIQKRRQMRQQRRAAHQKSGQSGSAVTQPPVTNEGK